MRITRTSAEGLLISALINSQDVGAAKKHGLTPDLLIGYGTEYQWLLNYLHTYQTQPSKAAFLEAFPDFQFCEHEDVRSAVDAVFKAFGKRRLAEAFGQASEYLQWGDLDAAWKTVATAEPMSTRPEPRKVLTDMSFLDDWDQPLSYVEVPYPTLQRLTGGIQPGNIWYLAARPGNGKTAHLVSIVKHAVLAGNRVRFFSLEMSEAEVRARFHAMLATHYGFPGITLDTLRHRTVDTREYKEFVQTLEERLDGSGGHVDIFTPMDGPCTPGTVAAGADEFHLNVVDYVGLMKTGANTRAIEDWRLAAANSNALKEIGLSAGTGVLAASQINREGDGGKNPPKISQLSQTDALGQDGDAVVTMRAGEHGVYSTFSLEKNRHGPSGVRFYTTFDPNRGIFREIDADDAQELVLQVEESL